MTATASQRPVVINGLGEIADAFDAVLLDQWGTLHQGGPVLPAAKACVAALRAAGKRMLILSNSGKRAEDNMRRLERLGLPRSAYDALLTSGEVAWRGLRDRAAAPFDRLGRRCLLLTRGGDRSCVAGTGIETVESLSDAAFIFLAGLDEARSALDDWRPLLTDARRRNLPMLCANPDLVMLGGDRPLPAPGAMARLYESLGGTVHYIGKPHAPMLAAARAALGQPPPGRILVVGDSLEHDILGGNRASMATALIAAGVHAAALADDREGLADKVRRLAPDEAHLPRWVLPALAW